MKTYNTIRDLQKELTAARPLKVGFVPTMGYLHEGHLSLARRARAECDLVVASIYVNRTQFGPGEDLDSYPRDLARDTELLSSAGVDLLFAPDDAEMYPAGFQTSVSVAEVTRPLEGQRRPGHFDGVATIVAKLFNIVEPSVAYFGQKDAQQVAVLSRMVRDLNFPIEMSICPTVREDDGLAMSSRNTYLSAEERQAATVLFRALSAAEDAWQSGYHNATVFLERMNEILASEPLADVDYVSAADPVTLYELSGEVPAGAPVLLSMAVKVGSTRLIDNIVLS